MTKNRLLHSLHDFLIKFHLIERGDKIIVSVSGGIDSMALLDLLCEIKNRWSLKLVVAHFNHQLRGKESDEDETFVRSAAKEQGLECFVDSADTNGIAEAEKHSIQEAARNLRYTFLTKISQSLGFHKIATAHNANDNAETMLLNLFRGTGIHGLTGIPVMRKDIPIIRPLLFATREEIRQYVVERNLKFREDSSNLKSDYTRNYLRNKLVPLILENINPNLTSTLGRTSELFNQLEEYIEIEAEKVLREIIQIQSVNETTIDLIILQKQPVFLQEHLLFQLSKQFTASEIDFSTVRAIMNILHAETGSLCSIARDTVIYRDRNHLIFKRTTQSIPYSYTIEPNKQYEFDTFSFISSTVSKADLSDNPNVEYIDVSTIRKNLTIRSWNDGDWFIPLGMNDKKKLSDFFIDQKVPLLEKQTIPILTSEENIVWICGRRLDNRFKITSNTKAFLKLEYIPRY